MWSQQMAHLPTSLVFRCFAGKRILTPEGKDGDANGAVIKAN